MSRPRQVDKELVAYAQVMIAKVGDLDALRRAQAVLLPALQGATLEQTAILLGAGRASLPPRLQA